jgi:hypothetical protein
MITIIYDPNRATGIADGKVEGFVDDLIKFGGGIIVPNESVINELRYRVCCDEISHEDIVFDFDNEEYRVNEYGAFIHPAPENFGDISFNRAMGLLRCAMKKKKEKDNKPA